MSSCLSTRMSQKNEFRVAVTCEKELGQTIYVCGFRRFRGREGFSDSKHHMAFIQAKNGIRTTATPKAMFLADSLSITLEQMYVVHALWQ
jgi:hypothetical protein